MRNDYGFTVNGENFRLVQEAVGTGTIYELRPQDGGMVASHLASHWDTIFMAASGCMVPDPGIGPFPAGERLLAVEWARHEPKPKTNLGEPEVNAYRYLFGRAHDGTYRGFEVTANKGGPPSGQVADHWMDYDTAAERFRGMTCL